MTQYKVIFRKEFNRDEPSLWQVACPLMISTIQVSRDTETERTFLQAKGINLTDDEISSYNCLFTIHTENGDEEVIESRSLDADIPAGKTFELKPLTLKNPDVTSADVKVMSVKQPVGEWFASDEIANSIPSPRLLHLSDEAQKERDRQLHALGVDPDIAKDPVADEGLYWICSCNQVNVGRDSCLSCGLPRNQETLQDEDALLESASMYANRKAKEATERDALRKKRLKLGLRASIALIVVALIVFAVLWITVLGPKMQYDSARSLYEEHKYSEAYEAFTNLGNYEDSAEWAQVAEAESLKSDGDLTGALEIYEGIDNSEKSIEDILSSMADYIADNPTPDNEQVQEYLETLKRHEYKDYSLLLGIVYPWSTDFSLTSKEAFEANGGQWLDSPDLMPFGESHYDLPTLLIRAKCTDPEASRQLQISWWFKNGADNYSSKKGEYSESVVVQSSDKIRSFPYSLYEGLGASSVGSVIPNGNTFYVSVTDAITNKELFAGEITKNG